MVDLTVLNFILHNILQANIACVAIFNCWNTEVQYTFAQLAAKNKLYTQYINMDNGNVNTDFEARFLNHKRPTLGTFLDMNCQQSEAILRTISRQRRFSDHYHWLLFDHIANRTNFRRLFEHFNLSVNADVTYAIPNVKNYIGTDEIGSTNYSTSFILYDVYNNGFNQGGKLNMTVDREIICDRSACQLAQYLSKLHLRPKYGNRNRLNDITLRIATVINGVPFTTGPKIHRFLMTTNNSMVDTISRYGYQVTMVIMDMLACNISFVYTDIWSRTETAGGSVGALANESVDFTSTPFLLTEGRLKYFTPLYETGSFRSVCMFRTPRNAGIKNDVFLEPFHRIVWYIFGTVLFIAAVFLWTTFFVEHNRLHHYLNYVPSFLSTCLVSFGSACIQGTDIIPRTTGGRMAFFSLSLASFIMYNYYTSAVVSSLLGSPVKSSVKTLTQLAQSPLDVGIDPQPYNYVYLNVSQLLEVRLLVKYKIESKSAQDVWIEPLEGLLRMRDKPGYVYVTEASTGYAIISKYFLPHEICDINEILLRSEKSIYTQLHKNSTYKEIIKLKEMRMLETGIYTKHRRYWMLTHLHCFARNFVIDVGLEYTAPLFFFLLAAYVLVIVLVVCENIHRAFVDKRKTTERYEN